MATTPTPVRPRPQGSRLQRGGAGFAAAAGAAASITTSGFFASSCAQRASAICVASICKRRRIGGQEALVEDDGAPAVAGQPLGLRLGEQELAPRIEREPRLEIADGRRVVTRLETLERAIVERLRRRVHRPFELARPAVGGGDRGRRVRARDRRERKLRRRRGERAARCQKRALARAVEVKASAGWPFHVMPSQERCRDRTWARHSLNRSANGTSEGNNAPAARAGRVNRTYDVPGASSCWAPTAAG